MESTTYSDSMGSLVAFCGNFSAGIVSALSLVNIRYTEPTICCTLSANSCMYSLPSIGRECRRWV